MNIGFGNNWLDLFIEFYVVNVCYIFFFRFEKCYVIMGIGIILVLEVFFRIFKCF